MGKLDSPKLPLIPGVEIKICKEGYKAAYNVDRGKKVELYEKCEACGASKMIGKKCPACGEEG